MTDDTTRTPAAICWHCDRMLDAATALEGQHAPGPGDISLCLYCGAVAFFDPVLSTRAPTKDELDELEKDKEFRQQYVRFSWARQYVMLNSHLLGHEAEGE